MIIKLFLILYGFDTSLQALMKFCVVVVNWTVGGTSSVVVVVTGCSGTGNCVIIMNNDENR
jgi:hypothetical protein